MPGKNGRPFQNQADFYLENQQKPNARRIYHNPHVVLKELRNITNYFMGIKRQGAHRFHNRTEVLLPAQNL